MLVVLVLLTLSLSGCSMVWNLTNRGALEKDINELFSTHGVRNLELECNMIGASRTGTCRFRPSPEQVSHLASGLGLEEVTTEEGLYEILDWEVEGGCRLLEPFNDLSSIQVYRSQRRAPQLRLSTGAAFEYLFLTHRTDRDESCVQVSYASG